MHEKQFNNCSNDLKTESFFMKSNWIKKNYGDFQERMNFKSE
jgi:hypothetical protein